MNRVSFLIDGFNLYHSLRAAAKELTGTSVKWLNIKALCQSYLYLFGREARLEEIYYFSALATHLEANNPDVTRRHKSFVRCLQETGITVELNRFKKKSFHCPSCQHSFNRYEEKETDVAIALKVLELFFTDRCDTIVLISGDTDLAPVVKMASHYFSENKTVLFGFPYKRKNKELAKLAPRSFEIRKEQYAKYQLANPFTCQDGIQITKPQNW